MSLSFCSDLKSLTYLLDYLPVYFQACKGASPIASGVDCFGLALVSAPCGITAGLTVAKSRHYRPQLWFAWALILIGTGLLSTLTPDSSRAAGIGYVVPIGVGIGILTTTTYFPVLAPLPVSSNGLAVSLFTFFRNFAQARSTSNWVTRSHFDMFIDLGRIRRRFCSSERAAEETVRRVPAIFPPRNCHCILCYPVDIWHGRGLKARRSDGLR